MQQLDQWLFIKFGASLSFRVLFLISPFYLWTEDLWTYPLIKCLYRFWCRVWVVHSVGCVVHATRPMQ